MKRRESSVTVAALFCALIVGHYAAPGQALINLEWRPMSQTTQVDDVVEIGLYAVSDDPETDQLMSAMDVIFAWDPVYLEFLGLDCTGCPPWLFSGFSNDPFGLNETIPPQDGDGLYTALAPLGVPVAATPGGTLVTTFQFRARAVTDETWVEILEEAGSPLGRTIVYDGTVPGLDVTGTLGSAQIVIVCQLCPGDLDNDGDIDLADLAQLLSNYGTTSGAAPNNGDMDCDGDVDLTDLAALLAVYGTTCP
jgi:hypothetical protein